MHRALALAFALLVAGPAVAQDKLVTKPSPHSVKVTMDKLVAALESKGVKPALRVDHAAAARANGLELKPTEVVFFGNPKLGTPLMQARRSSAIDLPMRVLAWEDDKGKTWIAYTAPQTLKTRHRIKGKGQDEALRAMAGALDTFTKAATE
jgi:uncharacterized protein (DUF302 family)